jgi:5-formyltetrahydrofolate cyclo-ligase
MPSKDVIRHEAQRYRDRIDPASENADDAADIFFDAIKPRQDQTVALTWSKGREFDTKPLIEKLLIAEIICCLPVMQKDSKILNFARWDESIPLVEGAFGVMQPIVNETTQWLDPNIVVVPLLAFDRKGHRIGYGGGYYDATLRDLRAKKIITAVGYCYAQQAVLFNLPADDTDERLDFVVTPKGANHFSL